MPQPTDAELVFQAGHADPCWRAKHLFGIDPVSYQQPILRAVRAHSKVAVKSAHGVGKTALAATAVLDFVAEGPCRVITTAPTWSQVEDLLWKEISKGYRKAAENGIPFGGNLYKTRLDISDEWFALGLSTDEPERFQGHHSPRLLLVVDEASGVDDGIYRAAKGFMTAESGDAHILLIGNPTRIQGQFHRAFTSEKDEWKTFTISAFDSPNVTGEPCSKEAARALVGKRFIEEMARTYGEDHPEYLIRVLGEFAMTTGRSFFRLDHLTALKPQSPAYEGRLVGDPVRGGHLKFVSQPAGRLHIFEPKQEGRKYVIFADIAGGVSEDIEALRPPREGGDYSCAQVVDLHTGCQVAEYHNRLDEADYAAELARLGWYYNCAEVCPENTGGYGTATITIMRDRYAYPRIYRREQQATRTRHSSEKYGWNTNATTRPQMLAELARVLREDPNRIRSMGVIEEMRTFVWNKSGLRAEADAGTYDDRLIALAGGFMLYQQRAESPIRLGSAPQRPKPVSVSRVAIGAYTEKKPRPSAAEDIVARRKRPSRVRAVSKRAPL